MKSVLITLSLMTSAAMAESPVVTAATASFDGAAWRFDVTLTHPDSGWDHYADAWEVVAPDGTVLGTRELAHPHEDEQPFTRSLSGIAIDEAIDHVLIRARCNVDGWGPADFRIELAR
jgi:hypothetical protein